METQQITSLKKVTMENQKYREFSDELKELKVGEGEKGRGEEGEGEGKGERGRGEGEGQRED